MQTHWYFLETVLSGVEVYGSRERLMEVGSRLVGMEDAPEGFVWSWTSFTSVFSARQFAWREESSARLRRQSRIGVWRENGIVWFEMPPSPLFIVNPRSSLESRTHQELSKLVSNELSLPPRGHASSRLGSNQ